MRYFLSSQSVCRVQDLKKRNEVSFWDDGALLRAVIALVRDNHLALLRAHSAMSTAMRAVPDFAHLRATKSTIDRIFRRLGFTRAVISHFHRAANPQR